MFPGQVHRRAHPSLPGGSPGKWRSWAFENSRMNRRTSSGMSSLRWRSGGTVTGKTFKRYQRSSRNRPAATSREVPVGRRDDADVHLQRPIAADALEAPVLEDPEQLRLQLGGELAHLVEEEGRPVGQLEPAPPLRLRAGEGALLVAEELALGEGRGQGGAVDLHERPVLPRAERVDRVGDQLLAGARLPLDEHRGRHRRHLRIRMCRSFIGSLSPYDAGALLLAGGAR